MFRHKDYVECIYKERSFGKAAEKLHVSQPALSAMIKRLEKELGAPLFNRKTTLLTLTPFGAEYLKSARVVTDLENRLRNLAYGLNTLQYGELTICAFSLSIQYRVSLLIAAFKAKFPRIQVRLLNSNTLYGKQMVDAYESDLMVSTKPMDAQAYVGVPAYEEHLILAVPAQDPINAKYQEYQLTPDSLRQIALPAVKALSLEKFSQVPFILANKNNYIRTCANQLFQEVRVNPIITMETESSSICLNFAQLGVGATICSDLLLEHQNFQKELCLYKLKSTLSSRKGMVYYRSGAYVTPAMKQFLTLAQEQYQRDKGL